MNNENFYSDEELVDLIHQGNTEACNLLLKRYHEKIRQMLFFYVTETANVNDLAQDVLLKTFRYLHCFKKECQFSTWLHRIVQNTIKNHYRAMSIRAESEKHYMNDYLLFVDYSPEHQLIKSEFSEQIEAAISRLSVELRLCYGMHIFEGQTYEAIAKKMHCPVGTIRSRISRARKLMTGYVRHIK